MFDIIASMTIRALRLTGNILYSIGVLILVPVGVIFISSANMVMLAGPIALLIPVLGAAFVGTGKGMTRKARQLEEDEISKKLMMSMPKNNE